MQWHQGKNVNDRSAARLTAASLGKRKDAPGRFVILNTGYIQSGPWRNLTGMITQQQGQFSTVEMTYNRYSMVRPELCQYQSNNLGYGPSLYRIFDSSNRTAKEAANNRRFRIQPNYNVTDNFCGSKENFPGLHETIYLVGVVFI